MNLKTLDRRAKKILKAKKLTPTQKKILKEMKKEQA